MLNILLINQNLKINHNNLNFLISNESNNINILQAKNLAHAEKIFSKNKINMLLILEPLSIIDNIFYNSSPKLTVQVSNKILNINIKDILFIESHKHKCILNTIDNNSISIPLSIGKLSEKISNTSLIRCHKSYIVNIENISVIDKSSEAWIIEFNNSKKIAFVSRSYRNKINEIFKNIN